MFITCVIIAIGVRLMVNVTFDLFITNMRLNHMVPPQPGWQMEVVKYIVTLITITPIIGFISAYK